MKIETKDYQYSCGEPGCCDESGVILYVDGVEIEDSLQTLTATFQRNCKDIQQTTFMTPQQIFEYKNRWMAKNPHCVLVDESSSERGKSWCREHLKISEWVFTRYVDTHEHRFCFERESHCVSFAQFIGSII